MNVFVVSITVVALVILGASLLAGVGAAALAMIVLLYAAVGIGWRLAWKARSKS